MYLLHINKPRPDQMSNEMAEVWPRRFIDFHSQAVNGANIRRELRPGVDLTVLLADNKQQQSRKGGGGEELGGESKEK